MYIFYSIKINGTCTNWHDFHLYGYSRYPVYRICRFCAFQYLFFGSMWWSFGYSEKYRKDEKPFEYKQHTVSSPSQNTCDLVFHQTISGFANVAYLIVLYAFVSFRRNKKKIYSMRLNLNNFLISWTLYTVHTNRFYHLTRAHVIFTWARIQHKYNKCKVSHAD